MNMHEELAANTDSAVQQELAELTQAKEHDAEVAAQTIEQLQALNKEMQNQMADTTADMAREHDAAEAEHVQAMQDVTQQVSIAQQSVESYKSKRCRRWR